LIPEVPERPDSHYRRCGSPDASGDTSVDDGSSVLDSAGGRQSGCVVSGSTSCVSSESAGVEVSTDSNSTRMTKSQTRTLSPWAKTRSPTRVRSLLTNVPFLLARSRILNV
jgi:hypothetical protein